MALSYLARFNLQLFGATMCRRGQQPRLCQSHRRGCSTLCLRLPVRLQEFLCNLQTCLAEAFMVARLQANKNCDSILGIWSCPRDTKCPCRSSSPQQQTQKRQASRRCTLKYGASIRLSLHSLHIRSMWKVITWQCASLGPSAFPWRERRQRRLFISRELQGL